MAQILHHGRYGTVYKNITQAVILGVNKKHMTIWTIKNITQEKPLLKIHKQNKAVCSRNYAMLVVKALRSVLKIRYLILGGTVGGGVTLHTKYTEWKDGLPTMTWLQNAIPDANKWNTFTGSLITLRDSVKDNITLNPKLKEFSDSKYNEVKEWLGERLVSAIDAANLQQKQEVQNAGISENNSTQQNYSKDKQDIRILQEELLQLQAQYQKEFDKLTGENKELRKQIILLRNGRNVAALKKTKKSLIDMYSGVLDELSRYEGGWGSNDHLPRVVVVGDQSAGKTSVLEMVAQARIFPRGAGEMMTRAPVKVTLSEGPYHVAQFCDSAREFDLTKENELSDLRQEVEMRMRNSVRGGRTISQEVISMSVQGPGLHRMVLVDLPGIISTQTVDMASDTRDAIKDMTKTYMNNPNAIILCIQDGSVDAERSNVTDLVSQCDPSGKRTIFVLTKVDMAEQNLANPNRIRKILSGKLFPMKALGYFAVVTGSGRRDDSIQTIKDYEENFFRNSKLFKDGLIMSNQVTTRNLSLAVAECFWKMVNESIEQQADSFKAIRFNLETEWKNSYPRIRELDRDELFEKARAEVLDESINLSLVSPRVWEEKLIKQLWDMTSTHVFENIYLPAAMTPTNGTFNTTVDIKLRQWAEEALPLKSIECGWETLQEQFKQFVANAKLSTDHDDVFDRLKFTVVEEAMRRHSWEDKGREMLRVLQLNTLQDREVNNKQDWDAAVSFLENSLQNKLYQNQEILHQMIGPSFSQRWLQWQRTTEEQEKRKAVQTELEVLLKNNSLSNRGTRHLPSLSYEEVAAVRKNLQHKEIDVDPDYIRDTWHPMYRKHFLTLSLEHANECRKGFFLYHQLGAEGEPECSDVILFWRIQQMMKTTANALRQQIMNREAHRLDKELKEVLEEFGQNSDIKKQLLTGKRVTLAEDLKQVRHIQEKLEEFIAALNKEKQ